MSETELQAEDDRTQIVELRGDIRGLSRTLDSFIATSEKRHAQHETEIDQIRNAQTASTKTNWPLLVAAVGLLGGMILLYIAPVRTDQDALKAQQSLLSTEFSSEIHRVEDERRRDDDKFDERLQREMRLLTDVVSTSASDTKEMILGRLEIGQKRIDDVTNRVDRMEDDDRRELRGINDFLLLKGKNP